MLNTKHAHRVELLHAMANMVRLELSGNGGHAWDEAAEECDRLAYAYSLGNYAPFVRFMYGHR